MKLCVLNQFRVHATPFNRAELSSSSPLSSNTIQIRLMIWTFQDIYMIFILSNMWYVYYWDTPPPSLVVILEIMYTVNAVRIFYFYSLTHQPAPTSSLQSNQHFFQPFILKFWNNTRVRMTFMYVILMSHITAAHLAFMLVIFSSHVALRLIAST